MPQLTLEQLAALRGKPVVDAQGEEIGEVNQVFFDEDTDEPKWVEVKRGFLGRDIVLVPVDGASVQDVELRVPFDRSQIEAAPAAEEIKALSPRSERELEQHYGLDPASGTAGDGADDRMVVRVVRVWVWPE
jgi:sporulation protein YlmC with PRC-barrel domain